MVRLRLDHLKPFANALNYTPEQILLWGRYPGTTGHGESSDMARDGSDHDPQLGPAGNQVPELDPRAGMIGGVPPREVRKDGHHTDPVKSEGWVFPASFVREQLHAASAQLLVVGATGDSMAPTIAAGDRVIVDTAHRTPSPDGLYAIRDFDRQRCDQAAAVGSRIAPDAGEDHFRQRRIMRPKKSRSATWKSSARSSAA